MIQILLLLLYTDQTDFHLNCAINFEHDVVYTGYLFPFGLEHSETFPFLKPASVLVMRLEMKERLSRFFDVS
jgi:ubiquitin-protein ligase